MFYASIFNTLGKNDEIVSILNGDNMRFLLSNSNKYNNNYL